MPRSATPDLGRSLRSMWLAVGVIAAAAILLATSLSSPNQSLPLLLVQVVSCGIILGLGRQGIDVLLLRLVVPSFIGQTAWTLSTSSRCAGPDCLTWRAFGVGFGAITIAGLLAIVAIPMAIVTNGGLERLRPEFNWRVPRTPREWTFVFLVLLVCLATLWVVLGIPANTG
jgi:hypothetical protein